MQQNVIGLYSGRNHCVSVIGVIVIMGEEVEQERYTCRPGVME